MYLGADKLKGVDLVDNEPKSPGPPVTLFVSSTVYV